MKKLGDLMMILDLHRQGVKIAAIARQVGIDRKTVRKYIGRGIEVPTYGPRQPRERLLDPYMDYLRARLEAYPGLSAQRLARELGERGYAGGYSTVRDVVRTLRPAGGGKPYAVRFETPAGQQAQVDFAQFRVRFADTPDQVQIVWLFSMVLGFSRLIWGRFVMRQTMPSVLACHRAAFEAIGGVPREILYDRMKTAVIGEDEDGRVVYNRTLGEFAKHYGFLPKACRAYRPETKGKVERPFRYIREDFFLGGTFRDLGTSRHEDMSVYYSPEIKKAEWDKIWSRVWMLVGHLNDIPKPNAFMKVDRGHESVLIVRGKGDSIRGMYNVCSHRGTRLVTQDFGSTKKFVCPFHKWEFSNTGELLKIQDRETFREEAICHNLNMTPVRTQVWRGWIFMTFDDDAPKLEDFLGEEFMSLMAPYDFEKVIRIRDVQQEWPANWKISHEAFIEGYHVQATHPQLVPAVDAYHTQTDLFDNGHGLSVYQFMSPSPQYIQNLPADLVEEHKIFLREAGIPEDQWPKHWSEVPKALINAKLAKKDYAIDYSKFTEGQLIDDWSFGIFPTTEMFLHPEGFFIQNWLPHPTDPEKCIYTVQVYAVPGIGELPSFMAVQDPDLSGKKVLPRTYIDTDNLVDLGPVISQDRVLVPRVQSGLHSKGFKGAVYSEQEIRIRHFFDEYFKRLNGLK